MDLVPGPAERQALIQRARLLVEAMENRHEAEIFAATPDAVLLNMLRPPGEEPEPVEAVLSGLTAAAQSGWDKAQGGDLAYIPSGGLFTGALGAWLASAIHAFTAATFEAPALVALEESVLRWIADTLGMPGDAEGILLSGGSVAHQTAIVCAREHRRAGPASRVYLTPRVHHSVRKGLRPAGSRMPRHGPCPPTATAGSTCSPPASPSSAPPYAQSCSSSTLASPTPGCCSSLRNSAQLSKSSPQRHR
jgi:aromatic-L-amino-acid/L-tryptophan decarboxylase